MKKAIFATAICVGLAFSTSAFARRWVAPVNGTVSAVMMPDGEVMMKIQLPAEIFHFMGRDTRANNNSCVIKEVYSASPNTMILVCGIAGSTVQ